MIVKKDAFDLKRFAAGIDWKLLIFLILFLDVKLGVKVIAILLIYLSRFDFKFGFRLKDPRLPLFYILIIGIALVNGIIYRSYFDIKYDFVFLTGIGLWILCILAIHQVKLSVDNNTTEVLHNTIVFFFILNAVFSGFNLLRIIVETHAINPYAYQGLYQKYFIGTGDYIKGITFDSSITNSVLNTLGVIYFLYRKNAVMVLLCMAVLLFSGSNSLNILLVAVLLILFVFRSTRDQKSLIVVCVAFLLVFMIKISPHNSNYAVNAINRVFHKRGVILISTHTTPIQQASNTPFSPDELRQKIARHYLDSLGFAQASKIIRARITTPVLTVKKLVLPQPNLDSTPYWEPSDTTTMEHGLLQFIAVHKASLPISGSNYHSTLPGKVIALQQIVKFLQHNPLKIFTGNGLGNFSSKVAFKATNLGFNGNYLSKYVYINKDFLANNLDVYLYFFSKEAGFHSVINTPNSVYYQLLGEYGLIGLFVFFAFYLGYFLRHYNKLSYGIPVLAIILNVFFLEYWFEQLSIMVFVELLLLLNIKEADHKAIAT